MPTIPVPTPFQGDISTLERTTLNGVVYDDTGAPLDGVTVKVRSLNTGLTYEVSTLTLNGAYVINAVPAGIQLEIQASKAGFPPPPTHPGLEIQ